MKKTLIGIISLCLLLSLMVLACSDDDDESDKAEMNLALSALTALADSHISSYANALDVLAMTEEVQSGNWADMVTLLDRLEETQVSGLPWFVLPDGSYYTPTLGKTDQNLSDRAYFPTLMAGNRALGDVVFSKATGNKSLIAASPVTVQGTVIGGLGASIFLADLSNTLASEIELSDDLMFYAVTQQGEVVLHSDPALISTENPDLPEDVAFAVSPLTGWTFALGFK